MKRDRFVDSRGDEYIFLKYNTGDFRIEKKTSHRGIRVVELSGEATNGLKLFFQRGDKWSLTAPAMN